MAKVTQENPPIFSECISEKELEEDNKRLEMEILVLTRNYEAVARIRDELLRKRGAASLRF